jgi:hypothetical protein
MDEVTGFWGTQTVGHTTAEGASSQVSKKGDLKKYEDAYRLAYANKTSPKLTSYVDARVTRTGETPQQVLGDLALRNFQTQAKSATSKEAPESVTDDWLFVFGLKKDDKGQWSSPTASHTIDAGATWVRPDGTKQGDGAVVGAANVQNYVPIFENSDVKGKNIYLDKGDQKGVYTVIDIFTHGSSGPAGNRKPGKYVRLNNGSGTEVIMQMTPALETKIKSFGKGARYIMDAWEERINAEQAAFNEL